VPTPPEELLEEDELDELELLDDDELLELEDELLDDDELDELLEEDELDELELLDDDELLELEDELLDDDELDPPMALPPTRKVQVFWTPAILMVQLASLVASKLPFAVKPKLTVLPTAMLPLNDAFVKV
jgi:hypothetical protein